MRRHLQAGSAAFLFALTPGCAGTISGQIDDRSVPSFSEAVFGGVEGLGTSDVFAVIGASFPKDSCADATELLDFNEKAGKAQDVDELDDILNDGADFINQRIPVGSWHVVLSFVGLDIDDVKEETYDLEKQESDEVSITFNVCLQEDEAEVDTKDGLPELDDGADCFRAGEGELTFSLNDDDSVLRVQGEKIEMQFDDGDAAGDVNIDFTFRACEDLADVVEDTFG